MSQLWMAKTDLDCVPYSILPEGFILRTYRPGDEVSLGHLYAAGDLGTETPEAVRNRMLDHPCFEPERIFIVEYAGELIGTSAAWVQDYDPGVGYLHMVAVLPEFRGHGLGCILTVAAIQYSRNEGFTEQRLYTDDYRTGAIRLYLDLGYHPLISDDTHQERWQNLAVTLNRPNTLAQMQDMRSR